MNKQIIQSCLRLLAVFITVAAVSPVELAIARTLVEAGGETTWKYLDSGSEPPSAWKQLEFDDSSWKSGKAPLGFGEARLGTEVNSGPDATHRPITTWFRGTFSTDKLQAGEGVVVMLCVDDGAVVYIDGKEVGRFNMPAGVAKADTFAAKTIGNDEEGFYHRLHVPAAALGTSKKHVLAVEVHQASSNSSDLFFDAAVKVLPPVGSQAEAAPAARPIIDQYNKQHYVGPGVTIPDGYIDGGRGMKVDAGGSAASGREILVLDRTHDQELAADLKIARSPEMRALAPLDRIQKLSALIDKQTTPPGGLQWVGEQTKQLEDEFTNKPVFIGDWVDQCQSGVCRHRALLFKVLADEAGLKSALVRGNYAKSGPPGGAHAWNEVFLDDGRRVLVDVMHQGSKPKCRSVTDPDVVARYLKVDNTPWYTAAGE
jgi:hypothetical protein